MSETEFSIRDSFGRADRGLGKLWQRTLPFLYMLVWGSGAILCFVLTLALWIFWFGVAVCLFQTFRYAFKTWLRRTPTIKSKQLGRTGMATVADLHKAKMIFAHRPRGAMPYQGRLLDVTRTKTKIIRKKLRHDIGYAGEANLLTLAGTGKGKGMRLIIPALWYLNRSIIVFDTKGQAAAMTAAHRKRLGSKIMILDPLAVCVNELGRSDLVSDGYNPLARIKAPELWRGRFDIPDQFVSQSVDQSVLWIDKKKNELQPFFPDAAIELGAGLLMWHCAQTPPDQRSYKTIRTMICAGIEGLKVEMEKMEKEGHLFVVYDKLRPFVNDNVQIQNVWAQLRNGTGFLDEVAYTRDLTKGVYDKNGEHFRFDSLKEECTTVYIVLPSNQMDPSKGGKWARIIVGDAIRSLLSSPRSKKHPPVLLMLDEAGTLGNLPGIREAANTLRDHGGTIWFFFQMLKQMEEIYGREGAEILMGACGAKTIFRTGDNATAEYVSKYCGKRTEIVATEGGGSRPDAQGHHVNYHPAGVPLYGPDDVTWNLLPDTAICLFDDLPGPVETHLPAIHEPELRYMMKHLRPNPYAPPKH